MISIKKIERYTPYILPFLTFAFLPIFMYANNAKEMNITQLLLPLLCMAALGYFIFIMALICCRNAVCAALFTFVFGMLILNFTLVEKLARRILPFARAWHIVPLAVLVIALLLAVLSAKRQGIARGICVAASLALTVLIGLNAATALPIELSKRMTQRTLDSAYNVSVSAQATRRNIYYILCDEYASFYQCSEYLGYDNEALRGFLTQNNFNISEDSYNTVNSTLPVLTNLMALDTLADENTLVSEMEQIRKTGALLPLLRKAGYTVRGVGATQWLGIESSSTDAGNSLTTVDGMSFTRMMLQNTLFAYSNSYEEHYDNSSVVVLDSLKALDEIDIVPDSSTFTMFYVNSPHMPFFFNAKGEYNVGDKYFNADKITNEGYLGQLQYITARITKAIDRIIKADKNATIILCSDHGYRFDTAAPIEESYRILNAVYYGGEPFEEISSKSTVDTMLAVLNAQLGINLPYKEAIK